MKQRSLIKLIVVIALAALVVMVGFFVFVQKIIRGNETYLMAMERLADCRRCTLQLGEPIAAGLLITGDITYSGNSGSSNLTIPVTGSASSGTLFARGIRENGEWTLTSVTLEADSGMINVLGEDVDQR